MSASSSFSIPGRWPAYACQSTNIRADKHTHLLLIHLPCVVSRVECAASDTNKNVLLHSLTRGGAAWLTVEIHRIYLPVVVGVAKRIKFQITKLPLIVPTSAYASASEGCSIRDINHPLSGTSTLSTRHLLQQTCTEFVTNAVVADILHSNCWTADNRYSAASRK